MLCIETAARHDVGALQQVADFGMRAFGAVFGSMHSAYALGGLLGPIASGVTFDQASS